MSRRRGEFEHRTSIFEGAFRAWSHLGGLEPIDLETKPVTELDPLLHPIPNDPRIAIQKEKDRRKSNKSQDNDDNYYDSDRPKSSTGREYPYEPLPRSGLVHPFVQAILSPWLGPDADQDAIQLGLTTLRTWWQHRRKGESGSAIVALGTEKMQGVVDGYTRHFFNLAHCLVVNDKEQPPRTLHAKMRDLEKANAKKNKKRGRDDLMDANGGNVSAFENEQVKMAALAFSGFQNAPINHPGGTGMSHMGGGNNNMNDNASGGAAGMLLDRLQASQRRLLAAEGGVSSGLVPNIGPGGMGGGAPTMTSNNAHQGLEMRERCIPGKVDLPSLVQKVNSAATQLAHRGGLLNNNTALPVLSSPVDPSKYGDPNVMPTILISSSGDIQFLMTVDGITCAHCVKIVETVLKGCSGRSGGSPIVGLLDASADQQLNVILIKIANISEARRIAHESARNLSMVGYTAVAKSVNITQMGEDMTLQKMGKVFEIVPSVNPALGNVLDWSVERQCPDNNVLRDNCQRHEQMSQLIFESFNKAEQLVSELVAGCGEKYRMPCTAGNHCFCKSGSDDAAAAEPQVAQLNDTANSNLNGVEDSQPLRDGMGRMARMPMRMSLGGLLGRHSLTSHTTFGRAMSGLSALSIDWENMDDFDINVDHSEGINNDIVNRPTQQLEEKAKNGNDEEDGVSIKSSDDGEPQQEQEDSFGPIHLVDPRTARRSSLRNPMMNNAANANMNVSFDM